MGLIPHYLCNLLYVHYQDNFLCLYGISILQMFFKSASFFPKACSMLVLILTRVMYHWRCCQMYISVCPLPHWGPPLFRSEQEVPQCTHSALALPPRWFGNAQRELIARKSSCPAGLPWLPTVLAILTSTHGNAWFPSGYCSEEWETVCSWALLLSTRSCLCPNGCYPWQLTGLEKT